MSDDQDFPVPDGWELAEDDARPGEPLHAGTHTIVNRGNNPLQQGETIAVWADHLEKDHGFRTCRADLQVIGDDGDGDIFAIHGGEEPLEASRVFRIRADLATLTIGYVYAVPGYDHEDGVLTVNREVKVHGEDALTIIEARSLGGKQSWAMISGTEL
jgi:hypothetical protein